MQCVAPVAADHCRIFPISEVSDMNIHVNGFPGEELTNTEIYSHLFWLLLYWVVFLMPF
jgi:hypothetical protein